MANIDANKVHYLDTDNEYLEDIFLESPPPIALGVHPSNKALDFRSLNFSQMKIFQLLFLLFTLTTLSCHEEKVLLKGCCQNDPLWEHFGNAVIFLPNIFTPNDDGINDLYYVQGDSILNVITFEVRGRKDKLVFEVENVEANDHTKAWDGKVDGVLQKGLYSVFVTVESLDGTVRSFETEVCNYPCGLMEDEEQISMEGCHFPIEWYCLFQYHGCQYLDDAGCFK